jgi:glutaredoxin
VRSSDPAPLSIVLYGRAGCHLCEGAAALLRRLSAQLGFELHEVDIDTDAELLGRFNTIVPVVVAEGRELGRAPLDAPRLEQRLRDLVGRAGGA